jgi:hypothetical protein
MAAISKFFRSVKNSFFLKKYSLSESTMTLLKDIYPSIDWKRVDFYEGLPWFTPYIAPYVTAQALPQFYSVHRYSIYIRKIDESRAQCLADIIHEGYHILQAMHLWKGYGIGFFRGLMIYYIALFPKYGYRQHPFEVPAYDQEYRFLDYCAKNGIHGISPKIPTHAFKNITKESSLVFRDFRFHYRENIFLLLASFILCGIITIIKPIADVLVFLPIMFFSKRRFLKTGIFLFFKQLLHYL